MEQSLENLQNEYENLLKANEKDKEDICRLKNEMQIVKTCMEYKNKSGYIFKRLVIPYAIYGFALITSAHTAPLMILLLILALMTYAGINVSYQHKMNNFREEYYQMYMNTKGELENKIEKKRKKIKGLQQKLENRKVELEGLYNKIDDVGIKIELEKFYKEELEEQKIEKEDRKNQIEDLYKLRKQYEEKQEEKNNQLKISKK